MAAAVSAVRSAIRSAVGRNVATRMSAGAKPAASPFRLLNQKALPHRIFRSPVEMSFCVETMLPYHTATASALLTSMLSATPGTYGLTLEDCNDDDCQERVEAWFRWIILMLRAAVRGWLVSPWSSTSSKRHIL